MRTILTPGFQIVKKALLTFSVSLLFLNTGFSQKNQSISGGNTVSSMVCANKQVYTWGVGIGSSPTPLTFPGNITIAQVNSGSGGHYIARDCAGAVWSWGNNTKGQLGNGTCCAATTVPAKVLASASIPASNRNAAGELINVNFVYSGNNNTYAVLNDGKLVSWGGNDIGNGQPYDNNTGQLGNGTTTSTTSAAYVIDGTTGLPLTGVTEVFAGDNVTYALVGSTVYSWGAGLNGTLGRDATGTSNPSSAATVTSSKAYPVVYAAGTVLGDGTIAGAGRIMNNITHISCGDVFGMALDANGYVWTWGNGAWNNSTGNTTTNYSGSDPRRVLKGTTTGGSNDGKYLLAKQIGGGQGYGMAVTADNKPVAWGGGGCAGGGATGNGTLTGSASGTGYIMRSAGVVDNNVIAINRGDLWGSYQTADNKIYTWGCNSGTYAGVLGLGNTTDQPYATQLVPPASCGFRDPVPTAKLTPRDTTVCQSKFTSLLLNSGFVIDPAIASYYTIKWFKDNGGAPVQSTTAAASATYTATAKGKYNVEVSYTGPNAGCTPYDVAKDSMTISVYPQTFTAPTNLTYCTLNPVKVNVISTSTTNPSYNWFPTAGSTTSLGSSVGSGTTSIDLTNATVSGTDRIVYVEEKAYASGAVMKKAQGCDPTWMASSDNLNPGPITDNTQSGFTVSEPVLLDSLSLMLQSDIYNVGNSYGGNITFNIYGNKTVNGGLVADQTNKTGTFTYVFNRTRTASDPQTVTQEVRVPVGIKLPAAGTYFISMDNFGGVTGSGGLKVGRGGCGQSLPVQDDVPGSGNIITYSGSSQAFSNPQTGSNITQGRFFNVNFKTLQHFCDRLPVTIKQKCPCQQPATVTATSAPAPVAKTATVAQTVSVCQGTAVNLTGSYTPGTNPLVNTIQYVWYKKGTVPTGASYAAVPVGAKSLPGAPADSGLWVLRVEDGNFGNASCYLEDSVKVVVDLTVVPGAIAADQTLCGGQTIKPLTSTTPGSGGNGKVTYSWEASVNGGAYTTLPGITTIAYSPPTPPATAPGSVTSIRRITTSGTAAWNCPSQKTLPVKITINKIPVDPAVPVAGASPACTSTTLTNTIPAGETYFWQAAGTPADSVRTSSTNPLTVTASGTYYVRASNNSSLCWSANSTSKMVVIEKPVLPGKIGTNQQKCGPFTPTPLSSVSDATTTGTDPIIYSWQSAPDSVAGPWSADIAGATAKTYAPGLTSATIYYRRKATSGTSVCPVVYSNAIKLTVSPLPPDPAAPVAGATPACKSTTLTNTVPAGEIYYWQVTGTPADSAKTSSANPLTVTLTGTYYVRSQNNTSKCWSANSGKIPVVINQPVVPGVVAANQSHCGGSGAPFTPNKLTSTTAASGGDGTTYTYTWEQSTDAGAIWAAASPAGAAVDYQPAPLTQSTSYRRKVASGICPVAYSDTVKISIGAIPADPTAITGVTPACPSSSLTLAAAPAGAAYFWQGTKSNDSVSTSPATSPYPVTVSGTYYARAQNTASGCWSLGRSNIAIVINSLSAGAIAATEVVCQGNVPAGLTSVTPGAGGSGNLTYQWQSTSDTTVAASWGNEAGATALTFPFTAPIAATKFYRRQVTSGTCVNQTYAVGKIFSPKPGPATAPAGLSPVCAGTAGVVYKTTAVTGVKFNWSIPAGTSITSAAADSSSITVTFGTASGNFVVTPYNSCGKGTPATLPVQVKPILSPAVSIDGSSSICAGEIASYYIKAANDSGTTPTYAWSLTKKSTGFTSVVSTTKGYSSTTLQNGDIIQLKLTSSETCTSNPSPSSNLLTIAVVAQVKPTVTLTPTSVCAGTPQTITANPTNGGSAPLFDWTVNGVAKQSGSGNTYSQTFTNGDVVKVQLTSNSGCAAPTKIARDSTTLTVKPVPVATANNPQICSGSAVDITLVSSVTPGTTYAWSTPADPQVTGIVATGITNLGNEKISQTLTLASTVTATKILTYTITPTANSCTGNPIKSTITIYPIPDVIGTDATVCDGSSNAIAITSSVSGATFTWTATASSTNLTGFADDATGTKTSISQLLKNSGATPEKVNYVVTASNSTLACKSLPKTITTTVNPTPVLQAVTQADICSGVKTNITLVSNVTGATFAWTSSGTGITGSAGSGTSTPIVETLTNSGATDLTMTYTVGITANTCPGASTPITFKVKAIPVGTSTVQAPLCGGNPTNITLGPTGATFTWTVAPNGTVTAPSPALSGTPIAQTLVNPGPNANTAVFTITPTLNGCKGLDFTNTVNVNPAPVVTHNTPPDMCSGDISNVVFTSGTPGTTYTWTSTLSSTVTTTGTTTGTTSSIAQPYTNSGATNGSVKFVITPFANNCPGGKDSVTVPVKPIPVATVTNANPSICSGGSTSITLSSLTPGTTFDVTVTGGAGSSALSAQAIGTVIAQALTASTKTDVVYTLTPTAFSCPGIAVPKTVSVFPIPVSNAGLPKGMCVGDTTTIGGPSVVDYKYSWTPKAGLTSDTVASPKSSPAATTSYNVVTSLRANSTCTSTASVVVTVGQKFTVEAGPDVLICAKEQTILSATPGGLVSYVWSNGAAGQSITVAPEKNTPYIVTASNGACIATDTLTVNIKNVITPTLYIPNSFSPNEDGKNDTFQASGESIVAFEGIIMNRWGEKIYDWKDIRPEFGWDGTVTGSGRKVQEDVYVYSIRVKNLCESNFSPSQTGTVTIYH